MKTKYFSLSGTLLVFLGAFFWSLNAPLVKFLSVDSLLLCGLRSLIAGITLLPFLRIKRLKFSPWLLIYLTSYCCLCIVIILSLKKTSAAIAIGMQYTSMIWLFLASALAAKKIQKKALFPVLLIFSGVFLFMLSGISTGSTSGNLLALTEGIFFAAMSVGAKLSAGTNPLGLTALANLFTGTVIFAFFPPSLTDAASLTSQEWLLILILGIVQIGAGYSCYNLGVQKIPAQKASIIALWEMILGPVWVALFLKEYPSLLVLAGFTIILAGMLVNARIEKQETSKKT